MSLKTAAEELLKIADEIEGQADQVTQFVCDKCNHTATLASINSKRSEMAKEAGENMTVSPVMVNDQISCPACDGVMSYKASEASEAYYYEPKTADDVAEEMKMTPEEHAKHEKGETPAEEKAEEKADPKGEKAEEKKFSPKEASEPIDYDSFKRYKAG